jgi:signal transduction histidine kinase
MRQELAEAKATVAGLQEQVRDAAEIPEDLDGAMAQVERLRAELAETKSLLHEARSEGPSLEELLDAAWRPGEGKRSPQDEREFARLREALQSSERELRRAREDLAALADDDPTRLDERVRELREALQRSEAERAMLRAGRPETVWEARVRELEQRLRSAEARASAMGSISEGSEELVTRLEKAEVGRLAAEDRARQAEQRAVGVEMRAKELAREVKSRFAEAEKSWQATAAGELTRLRTELQETAEKLRAAEERAETATTSEDAGSGARDGAVRVDASVLETLEARVEQAEHRAQEAELLLRDIAQTDEERAGVEASELRRRLSQVTAARRPHEPRGRRPLSPALNIGPLDDLREAVAYELRGPVASLRGLALALRGAVTTADGRDLVRQLGTNVRKIDQLVTDLAAVAKLAEGAITLRRRRVDITALVTRVVEEADGFENRVLLLDGEPVNLAVDPGRVEQIVDSLLANARGRTTKGQSIRVHVASNGDGVVLISIDDDGRMKPEIAAELSLAMRLAEAHGGRLWVEPLPKGASFRVELRSASAAESEASA